MKFGRRALLVNGAASAAACGGDRPPTSAPNFVLVGQSPRRGHALRSGELRARAPDNTRRANVIIVGGGAAGTSAAWELARRGTQGVVVLELESAAGGTARTGRHDASAYPMGAHYLPVPGPQMPELTDLLDELDLIVQRDGAGAAQYVPSAICAAPTERHFHQGLWAPGLYPGRGQTSAEADDWSRWMDYLRKLDDERDTNGTPSFRLPVHRSGDAQRALDSISMAQHLDDLGINSWRARWLIDYACRDDYGCTIETTSAFAGVHHFLSRGLEERRDGFLLAFPGGNGELLRRMRQRLADRIEWAMDTAVVDIDETTGTVLAHDFEADVTTRWRADAVIWAAPRFVLPHIARADPLPRGELSYSPWLVANVEVRQPPAGYGAPLSWDNVPVDADHLGYVVATHGRAADDPDPRAVLTFYQPFEGGSSEALARQRATLLTGDATHWGRHVLGRLAEMHPDIGQHVSSVHIHRWGHAMIRPVPGLLFGGTLARAAAPFGRVIPCGTDTRGLALFEEAFYAGMHAARWATAQVSAASQ